MKVRCFIITLISFKLDYKLLRDFVVTAYPNFNDHTLITKDSSDGPPINTTVSNLNPIFPSMPIQFDVELFLDLGASFGHVCPTFQHLDGWSMAWGKCQVVSFRVLGGGTK